MQKLLVYVDKLFARESIRTFVKYCDSTELTDLMTSINSTLKKSKGETKEQLDEINLKLTQIVVTFMQLMANTKDFIENATDLFEEMDIKQAKQIKKID